MNRYSIITMTLLVLGSYALGEKRESKKPQLPVSPATAAPHDASGNPQENTGTHVEAGVAINVKMEQVLAYCSKFYDSSDLMHLYEQPNSRLKVDQATEQKWHKEFQLEVDNLKNVQAGIVVLDKKVMECAKEASDGWRAIKKFSDPLWGQKVESLQKRCEHFESNVSSWK